MLHYYTPNHSKELTPWHVDSSILTIAFPAAKEGLVGVLQNSFYLPEPILIDLEQCCSFNDLIVFGGEKLETLSNKQIKAFVHKVVNTNVERYSAPFKYDIPFTIN